MKKMYEETSIQAIADAIRTINKKTDNYKVSEMADAISSLQNTMISSRDDIDNLVLFNYTTLLAKINDGTYANWYRVGDEFSIPFNGTNKTFVIAGIDFDTKTAGGKAPISLVAKDPLLSSIYNSSRSLTRYSQSEIRTNCNSTYKNYLPSDIVNRIVSVNKNQTVYSSGTETSSEDVWLLSVSELGLDDSGTNYPIFINNNSRVRYSGSDAIWWWLRDIYPDAAGYPYLVRGDGTLDFYRMYNCASYSFYVVVGFSLG